MLELPQYPERGELIQIRHTRHSHPHRHSRVGGKPQGGVPVPSYWLISPSPLIPLPSRETFTKLSGTAIMCPDSQSLKLHFPIDSRLHGNDGRFCKGLHQGRGDSVGCVVLLSTRPVDTALKPV